MTIPCYAVTGADGFIGSHLVETILRTTPARVRGLSYYNAFGHAGWLDQVRSGLTAEQAARLELVSGDIRDSAQMRRFVQGTTRVIHLAALIAIPYSYQAAESYVSTNVTGTLNLLEAARHSGIERFVQLSSSEVYGTAQTVPMTESHPLAAQSPYAATKIAADHLALSFWYAHQLPVTVARPFNTFGPRQSVRALIPTIIVQALNGGTIALGRLNVSRDLTYVKDLCTGLLACTDPERKINGDVINLASGQEQTVTRIVDVVGSCLGRKLEVIADEKRLRPDSSEVYRLVGDTTKAMRLLGWHAATSFENGIEATIAWFSQRKNRERFHLEDYRL